MRTALSTSTCVVSSSTSEVILSSIHHNLLQLLLVLDLWSKLLLVLDIQSEELEIGLTGFASSHEFIARERPRVSGDTGPVDNN